MSEEINLTNEFYNAMMDYDKENSEEHKHPKGRTGASSLGKGTALSAIFKGGVKDLPQISGLKAFKGGMWVGSWDHEKIQEVLENHFKKTEYKDMMYSEVYIAHPLTMLTEEEIYERLDEKGLPIYEFLKETKKVLKGELQNFVEIKDIKNIKMFEDYIEEVPKSLEDVCLEHTPWLNSIGIDVVVSPIDFAMVSSPGIIYKELEFKNKKIFAPFKHPEAKFLQLWDIKTSADYGFYKMWRGELSESYLMQFSVYMKAAKVNKLKMFAVRKENLLNFEREVEFDESIYRTIVEKRNRINELAEKLNGKSLDDLPDDFFEFDDLSCLYDKSGIGWYSCPLSKTYEEEDNNGKVRLKLEEPCRFANYHLAKIVPNKYTVGSTWKRGRSIITIEQIDERVQIIKARNKSGAVFTDSFGYAYMNYK